MGSSRSRRASSGVIGAQTMPEVWRMMNAIFSGVQSDAATKRSPSFSRSSSSVTTTISPLRKASIAAETRSTISFMAVPQLGNSADQTVEQTFAVCRAQKRVGGVLGVRHQPQDVALGVQDSGDVARGAVWI